MDLFQKLALLGSNVFTGPQAAGVTPEQNRGAVGQGLTAAGLRTILASQPGAGPGGLQPTALGAIAQGALAGQQAGGAARAGAQAQNQQATLQEILAPGDLASLEEAFRFEMGRGNIEGAKAIGEVLDEQQRNTAPASPERLDLGDRVVFYDPTDPSKIVETILKTPDATEEENRLATAYAKAISTDIDVARALSRVIASAEAPSAAGDMSLVFAYMKLLDPIGSVREGEQTTVREAGNIPARVVALYNRAVNGETFSADVRADFVDRTRRLVKSQIPLLEQQINLFRRRAEARGANADLIIFNPYEPFADFLGQDPTYERPGAGRPPLGTINPITGQPIGTGR